MANDGALLVIDRVSVRFGAVTAVNELSLRIEAGQILGLIGPNGSGKTTTIRAVTGLQICDEGTVRVEGCDVSVDPFAARRRLAWVPDQYGVYDTLTVRESLEFYAGLHDMALPARERIVREVLARFSLEALEHTLAGTLSRGVRQRLMMARMQMHRPALLILDEPAGGLDPRARRLLFDWLRSCAANGQAVLITSHVLTELTEICTHVAVLEAGRLMVTGSVEDVGRRLLPSVEIRIEILEGADRAATILGAIPSVRDLKRADRVFECRLVGTEADGAEINRMLAVDPLIRLVSFHVRSRDLEAIFMAATRGDVT
jgi:ABC-2 type transport system ATP-binding protein